MDIQESHINAIQALEKAIDDEETLHNVELNFEEENVQIEDNGIGLGRDCFEAFLHQMSSNLSEEEIEEAVTEFENGLISHD